MVAVSTKMNSVIESSRITAVYKTFKKLSFTSQFVIPCSEIDLPTIRPFDSGSRELMGIQLSNADLVVKTDFTG